MSVKKHAAGASVARSVLQSHSTQCGRANRPLVSFLFLQVNAGIAFQIGLCTSTSSPSLQTTSDISWVSRCHFSNTRRSPRLSRLLPLGSRRIGNHSRESRRDYRDLLVQGKCSFCRCSARMAQRDYTETPVLRQLSRTLHGSR